MKYAIRVKISKQVTEDEYAIMERLYEVKEGSLFGETMDRINEQQKHAILISMEIIELDADE